MHESSLVTGLVAAALDAVPADNTSRVRTIDIEIGMLSAMSPTHLKDHFAEAAAGTPIADAEVVITRSSQIDEHAGDVVLRAIHLEAQVD